jgi:N-acetylneuraminic acid mutarotase
MKKYILLFALFIAGSIQAQNTWVTKVSLLGIPRHSASSFSIGTKGYVFGGTSYPGDTIVKDLWEWNQSNGAWTQKATLPLALPRYAAASFSIGTKGYVCGGADSTSFFNQLYEYNQANNTWYTKTAFPGGARAWAVGFSIGTQGYIATGSGSSGYYNDLWEWDQTSNAWTQKANFPGSAREAATGFSIGTKGYLGIGEASGNYESDFWEWDQTSNVWTRRADFKGGARSSAVGFSIGTQGFIGTGITPHFGYCKDFWEYNPAADIWVQRLNFAGSGRILAFGYSIGTKGYIGAGFDGTSFTSVKNYYEYTPLPAGMDELAEKVNVSVFPNPFFSSVKFELEKEMKDVEFNLFDISGKEIYRETFSGKAFSMPRNGLPNGIYFYRLGTEGKTIASGKLSAE